MITLYPQQLFQVDDRLAITVSYIMEQWYPLDRRSVMSVSLRMKCGSHEETVEVTSDEPRFRWEGYSFTYLGGWRDCVKLTIKKE
jgi:hypothetical protein